MPTLIALDVSLSMQRIAPGQNEYRLTYHQIAVAAINRFLQYLTDNSKMEFVSLLIFSGQYEILVDFTRDYDAIREELTKVECYDKTSIGDVFRAANTILTTNWGAQNLSRLLVLTDGGIGFGATSMRTIVAKLAARSHPNYSSTPDSEKITWLPLECPSRINFLLLNSKFDLYFKKSVELYEQILQLSGQKGSVSTLATNYADLEGNDKVKLTTDKIVMPNAAIQMIEHLCEKCYKPFSATLKCGGYFRLESPVTLWPPPVPYTYTDDFGNEVTKNISSQLEICGYLKLADIGSPMSISRHLIGFDDKANDADEKKGLNPDCNELQKLEQDIKSFYSRSDGTNSDDEASSSTGSSETSKESVCIILHGALKSECSAALVLLKDEWYGFIYSYADTKKKSNLMLTILPPGNEVVPWLGDFRCLGTADEKIPGDTRSFPIKQEKRSYSQNCVVWIKQAGLQSDIQKVLRHAKKLPEKTQHFFKELNRIRRAALSLGFVQLLDGLSHLLEREIANLPSNASPECQIQLKHAALELSKPNNRDLKSFITALPSK